MNNLLISYSRSDYPWVDWITWILEENGYAVITQMWNASGATDMAEKFRQAIAQNQKILMVMSAQYLSLIANDSSFISLWNSPDFPIQQVISLQTEELDWPQWLPRLTVVDLVDKSESEAEKSILDAVKSEIIDVGDSSAIASTKPVLKQRRQSHTVQFFVESLSPDLGIEVIYIPGGTFLMGSPEDELERSPSEGPQHEVTVPPFFMGKYPVTQAQWRFVAGLPEVNRELNPDPSNFKGEKRPVEQVSWFDAVEFCDRLSIHTGRTYRLPTEAEWEYACRAGTTTPFHFGETITTDLANYRGIDDEENNILGSYGCGPKGVSRRQTTPVNYFEIANPFGLCDMYGNVWEWCLDHWHESYEGVLANGSAWLSGDSNLNRVLRGGSWLAHPWECRSASRYYMVTNYPLHIVGFRVVCNALMLL